MSRADVNLKIVTDAYACYRTGDLDGFFKHFNEDSLLVEAPSLPYGGTFRGIEAGKKALMTIGGAWTDIKFDIAEVLSGEKHVAAYGVFSATAKNTGRKVEFPLAEIWRIEGERVLSVTPMYFDTAATAAALTQAA